MNEAATDHVTDKSYLNSKCNELNYPELMNLQAFPMLQISTKSPLDPPRQYRLSLIPLLITAGRTEISYFLFNEIAMTRYLHFSEYPKEKIPHGVQLTI